VFHVKLLPAFTSKTITDIFEVFRMRIEDGIVAYHIVI